MQYADDAPILQARVESGLRKLSRYYDDWGSRSNLNKTYCVFYTKRHRRPPLPPTLQAAVLSWSPVVKYLGVHLDATLTCNRHIAVMVGRAKGLASHLSPVLTPACPLSQDDRVRLWRTLVLPVLTYAAVVWAYTPPSCYRPVVWTYNTALRLILGSPHWTAVIALYKMAGVERLAVLIRRLASRFYHWAAATSTPSLLRLETTTSSRLGLTDGSMISCVTTHPNVGAFTQ
ncbi:hypothetical protein PR048_019786 [Dryococelus australis]|uniref:Reverse transcriptase n=1 Tax=Dryococelus australis TaxID=614101 RepID=A0ABQ9H4F7_9NEOP|nr:hypothetical protein PR048_019786 [Dryococelus australis]